MTPQQDKNVDAFEWAGKIAAYLNEHYPEIQVEVLANISGNRWELHWLTKCESLAVIEEVSARYWEDPGFLELIPGSEELVVHASWTDTYYRVLK
jgi:hypothetical protein